MGQTASPLLQETDALHYVVDSWCEDNVNEFIRRGADLEGMDSEKGITALHWATRNNQSKLVRQLIERKANIEATTETA